MSGMTDFVSLLTPDVFRSAKMALAAHLVRTPDTLTDQTWLLWREIAIRRHDFTRALRGRDWLLAPEHQVQSLSVDAFRSFFASIIGSRRQASVSVQVRASGNLGDSQNFNSEIQSTAEEERITKGNLDTWKLARGVHDPVKEHPVPLECLLVV